MGLARLVMAFALLVGNWLEHALLVEKKWGFALLV